MNRRTFVKCAGAAGAAVLGSCLGDIASPKPPGDPRLKTRPFSPTSLLSQGLHDLELGTGDRDGRLYIPENHTIGEPLPLLVVMHGAGGTACTWFGGYGERAEAGNFIVLAPESRGPTWDMLQGGFGADVAFIDSALEFTFRHCAVDSSRMALAGFSDGATYALGLGRANGDLFSHLIAYSPGFLANVDRQGMPKVFVSHGIQDPVLSFFNTRDDIVPRLRSEGYDVTFQPFEGEHSVPAGVSDVALNWFDPAPSE